MSDCLFVKLKFDFHTLTPTVDLYRDQIFVEKFEEHVLNVFFNVFLSFFTVTHTPFPCRASVLWQ